MKLSDFRDVGLHKLVVGEGLIFHHWLRKELFFPRAKKEIQVNIFYCANDGKASFSSASKTPTVTNQNG